MDTAQHAVALPTPSHPGRREAGRRAAQWAQAPVSAAMSRPVLSIQADESLWDAWQLLVVSGLRHLVVVDDGHCLGVLSDRMILTDVPLPDQRMRERSVGDLLASALLHSVSESAELPDVARMMVRHSAEAIPVLDDQGRPIGIVTGSDLVRWWADET
jgi:CBS domain-containing protein